MNCRYDEPVSALVDRLLYFGLQTQTTWEVGSHSHDHFELCLVDEGNGWFVIEEALYRVRKGDVILTKPGEAHRGAAAGDGPYRLYYLGFRPLSGAGLEVDFFTLGSRRIVVDVGDSLRHLFGSLMEEMLQKPPHYQVMVGLLVEELLVLAARSYASGIIPVPLVRAPVSPEIQHVLEHVHADVSNRHTVGQLARDVNLSRTHLAREFKRQVGVPLGSYLRLVCTDRAKQYLRETPASVSWIAERLQFPSIHAFSAYFKRETGQSPQAYRRRVAS